MNMYVCIEASGSDSQEMPHLTWEVIMERLSRVYSEFNSLHCICLGYLYLVCSYLHIWNMNFINRKNDIIYHAHKHYDFTTIMILPSLVHMHFIPASFGPWVLSLPAYVCASICVCVCHVCVNSQVVHTIAHHLLKLKLLPNLDKRCKTCMCHCVGYYHRFSRRLNTYLLTAKSWGFFSQKLSLVWSDMCLEVSIHLQTHVWSDENGVQLVWDDQTSILATTVITRFIWCINPYSSRLLHWDS